ncbi:MAG: hypothetical protein IPH76_10590 [Xanthomonadales bacterium]|nr:hypothetical protein [Xanthomonadales bacterium]
MHKTTQGDARPMESPRSPRSAVSHYAAKSWSRKRRVIVRAEHREQGSNPRSQVPQLIA